MIYDFFIIDNCKHYLGDRRCVECLGSYPRRCKCGGLIHGQYLKKECNGELKVKILCDKCQEGFLKQNSKKTLRKR